jgi:molecular chaperone GrpE
MTDTETTPEPELVEAVEGPAPEEQIAALEAEIVDLKDRLLRAAAETENTRRRLERDKADTAAYAMTGFARDLLAVADNLRRAVEALPTAGVEGVTAGVEGVTAGIEATERELIAVFNRNGITRIDSQGQKLDPNKHQAMLEVPTADAEPGTVVAELQAGWTIKDRLLRPALVSVAKAPE